MNSLSRIKTATLLCSGLLALAPLSLHAQTISGWPSWSAGVQTIGGITYFNFGARLPDCDWIVIGPVYATGRSFNLSVQEVRGDFCIDCFGCYNLQTNSVVLGRLAPRNYSLTAWLWLDSSVPAPIEPEVWQTSFTVPAEVEPTLTIQRTSQGIRVDMRTAAAAQAVLYGSTDLREWRVMPNQVAANGPFSFTVNPRTSAYQFFRVRVSSGSVVRTVF